MQQSKSQSILLVVFLTIFCQNIFAQNIPYCDKGKWGFATKEGKIIIPCIYEEVDFYSFDSLAKVKKNGKYGYINNKGIQVIPVQYDNCTRIYEPTFSNTKRNSGVYLNENVDYQYFYNNVFDYQDFQNNRRYIISKDKKYGVISLIKGNFKIAIPLNYSRIQFDPDKKIFHCTNALNTLYFNTNGQKLTLGQMNNIAEFEYHDTVPPPRNRNFPIIVRVNGKVGVVSSYNKDTLVSPIYDVKMGGKWGFIDKQKTILLPIEFDAINFELSKIVRYEQRIFVVKKNKHWGIVEKKNKANLITTVLPFEYEAIKKVDGGFTYALVQKESQFQIYNILKNEIISKSYSSITLCALISNFALFQVPNKLGQTVYIGENGIEFFVD